MRICCLLGMLGSLATIYAYLVVSYFKISMGRPIALIALCLLFDAGAKLVSTFAVELRSFTACRWAALFVEATSLSSVSWMLFLTLQLLLVVSWSWNIQQIRRTDFWLFAASLMFPYSIAVALYFVKVGGQTVYGKAALLCWVRDDLPSIQLLSLTVPLLTALLLMLIAFGVMLLHVYQQGQVRQQLQRNSTTNGVENLQTQEQLNRFIVNASVYVSVFLIFWLPTAASQIFHAVNQRYSNLLLYLTAIFSSSGGVFNFLLYAFLAKANAARQETTVTNLRTSLISEFKMRKRSLGSEEDVSPTALFHKKPSV